VVLSVLAHLLFCAVCLVLIREKAMRRSAEPVWVDLAPSKRKPAPSAKERDDERKRMVQSNAGREEKIAAPDSFMGEKTRVVDLQTVNSKKAVEAAKPGMPAPTQAKADPRDKRAEQAKERGQAVPDSKGALAKLGLAILPEARRKGAAEDAMKDVPQWANVGAQPQDYVQGIKESDRTALNTREYLYFGYHQRIRQKLELEWTRLLRAELLRFYKSGRRLASEMEYSTRLMVILNDRGEITRIKILDMSGTQELDNVAVQAFNKAGPFPNPPKGLVKNGEVEIPWELKLRS
jgi:TonB family protein